MNQTELKCFDTLLAAYTDKTMSQDERTAFEQSIENDPAMRAKFELQSQVDRSLVDLFGQHTAPVSVMDAVRAAADQQATADQPRTHFFMHRRWAMAALLFISACIAWEVYLIQAVTLANIPPQAQILNRPSQPTSLMGIYLNASGPNLRDIWTNTDSQNLAETFKWRQGQVLRFKDISPTTQLLGKGHMHGISKFTTAILFEVDDEDVVVFVDRAELDHARFMAEQHEGLNIFPRYLGELVIYEVTPHEMPQLLDKFYEAGI